MTDDDKLAAEIAKWITANAAPRANVGVEGLARTIIAKVREHDAAVLDRKLAHGFGTNAPR